MHTKGVLAHAYASCGHRGEERATQKLRMAPYNARGKLRGEKSSAAGHQASLWICIALRNWASSAGLQQRKGVRHESEAPGAGALARGRCEGARAGKWEGGGEAG